MAVAFQSSSFTAGHSGTTNVITKPTGLSVGDLMIGAVMYDEISRIMTIPSGWTLIQNARGNQYSTSVSYKIADSTDVAASNFTWTTNGISVLNGGILRFTGASVPQPVFSSNKVESSAGALSIPSISTLANSILFMAVINGANGSVSAYSIATSNPTWTELWDEGSTNYTHAVAYSSIRAASTATGTGTATITSSTFPGGVLICIPPDQSIIISDTISLIDSQIYGYVMTFLETLSLSDTLSTFKSRLWRSITKPITTWRNRLK